ncbi:MAG: hypothetical protein C5B50_09395 [Verrucomicrobia bacterium]|nr:MAG: hypothetical protein C5B50_09395 [Verrucomicrobiota bacterium]
MLWCLTLFLSWLVVGIPGCARPGGPGARPQEFAEWAQKFKDKAGRDRRAEGEKIQSLLPHCPKTWEKDIGTGILMAFDYTQPSYKLTKPELFRVLGQPDGSYNDSVYFLLDHDTNNMLWEISVDFHDDYVVSSIIFGVPQKDR